MRRLAGLIPVLVAVALAAVLVVLSDLHAWSSSLTTWGLAAILAAPTVIDFVVLRWRRRSARHHDDDGGAAHPAK